MEKTKTLKSFHVQSAELWEGFTDLARSQGRSATWAINFLLSQAVSAGSLSLANSDAPASAPSSGQSFDPSAISAVLTELREKVEAQGRELATVKKS